MRKCRLPNFGDGIFEEDVEILSETWNTYKLKNGTIVRIKTVVDSIIRFDKISRPDGQPFYLVNTQNVIVYLPPEEPEEFNQSPDPGKIFS